MFKLPIAFLTASLAAISVASAADLPFRTAPPILAPAPPIFTWTGFYVGVNAGAAFNDVNHQNGFFFPLGSVVGSEGTNGTLSLNNNGSGSDVSFTGGGQIGYNYQFGGSRIVAGIEADAQYLDFGGNHSGSNTPYTFTAASPFGVPALGLAFAPPAATVNRVSARNVDYFGTVRGRIGYAFDRFLPYVTGGFAYGGGDTDFGYAVGGGLEYAFAPNVSVKVEGLYVNLGSNLKNAGTAVYDVNANVVTVTDFKRDTDFGVARVGLNYRF